MLEDADSLPRRPGNVPADLWHWIVAEVGIDVAQHVDPQVAVVLAARLATRRGPPGTESAEALRLWPWFIDSSRRLAQQQEMMFIECALAAGWTHDQVRTAEPSWVRERLRFRPPRPVGRSCQRTAFHVR